MEVSLAFLVILVFILFPGLIFRRLYFYGEFSKEFNTGQNLASLLALSTIPGIIIVILSFILYSYLFVEIDLGEIIDRLKDLNNPDFRLGHSKGSPFNTMIFDKVIPFIGFQYVISFILGTISGRIIRISKLDTKFKILRFKNYWFYIFNGQYAGFKKLKHLTQNNQKHLFTKADILIDTSSNTHLYSGIVIDYELSNNDCCVLNKVYLQNAERYSLGTEGKRVPVKIPGTLLVVDCSSMKNINLTYIYEDAKDFLRSKIPNLVEIGFGLIYIFLIPLFIFKAESIKLEIYNDYFNLSWYNKILTYLITTQALSLFNPFVKIGEEYQYVKWKVLCVKFFSIGFLLLLMKIL
jgi:hypothetical protein